MLQSLVWIPQLFCTVRFPPLGFQAGIAPSVKEKRNCQSEPTCRTILRYTTQLPSAFDFMYVLGSMATMLYSIVVMPLCPVPCRRSHLAGLTTAL